MEKLAHSILEKSPLYLDLSNSLLNKIDLFLSNTNLDPKDKEKLVGLFREVYGEAYTNCIVE